MIDTTPAPVIQLDQFLKLANVVDTGGQVKRLIQGGEVETRRKKKLFPGDVVEVFDMVLEVGVERWKAAYINRLRFLANAAIHTIAGQRNQLSKPM